MRLSGSASGGSGSGLRQQKHDRHNSSKLQMEVLMTQNERNAKKMTRLVAASLMGMFVVLCVSAVHLIASSGQGGTAARHYTGHGWYLVLYLTVLVYANLLYCLS